MSEAIDQASVLGIKMDSHITKLFLFDVVDGKFHLLATSEADSSHKPPYNDIREGFFKAIDYLQNITGRTLIDGEMNLIVPSQEDSSGVDQVAITFGFLDQVSIITAGLLDIISIESLTRTIGFTHLSHVDQIRLNDSRKIEEILSSIVSKKPDMLMLAGGTENGANKSVMRMLEVILFCIKLLPPEKLPELIYAGNSSIADKVQELINPIKQVTIADNIRPTLDEENLSPALQTINELNVNLLKKKLKGFEFLNNFSKSTPIPSTQSLGIMTTFLSKLSTENNSNLLVIDFNKELITFSGVQQNKLNLNVCKNTLYADPTWFFNDLHIHNISQWMFANKLDEFISNYLGSKSIRPETIPEEIDEYSVEICMIKEIIRNQYENFKKISGIKSDQWNQIVINGDFLNKFENPSEIALILLDSIQPKGVANIFIDHHGILPVLGAISKDNPLLPVQILEGSNISLLAKVFSVQSKAKEGTPILKIRIEFKDGTFMEDQVIKGTITKLALATGQIVKLFFEPLENIDLNQFGKNAAKGVTIQSGLCGLIIDARGRPIQLPKNSPARVEKINSWRKSMGVVVA